MRRLLVAGALIMALAVVGVVVLVGGDDDGGLVCTLIGCEDAVQVTLDDAAYLDDEVARLRACVADQCGETGRGGFGIALPFPDDAKRTGAELRIDLELLDADGRTLRTSAVDATVDRNAPNGEDCGPICFGAGAVVHADGQLTAFDERRPLTAPTGGGVDILAGGQVARFGPGTVPDAALPLRRAEAEVRTATEPERVRISYGARSRVALDIRRDRGVWRALVPIPARCDTDGIVVHVRRDGQRRDYPVPARC